MTIAVISMIRDIWGGSEELWYQMAKQALKKGHKVIHVRFEHPQTHEKLQELMADGLVALTRPGWIPPGSEAFKKNIYTAYNFLRKQLKNPFDKVFKENPDVVLYNGTCYSIAKEKHLLIKLKKHPQVNFFLIGHLNNDLKREISDEEAEIIRGAYQRSVRVFFVSHRSRSTAARHLCMTITNSLVIQNPVNMPSVDRIKMPPFLTDINFALVGNLITEHKGQDLVLQALSSTKWLERNWKLNIYGDGIDRAYLANLIRHFQLEEKVVLHGRVRDIRKIWTENHALLMPSLMEGMPLAVVEAMLCGRVCIATNVGGCSEWIDDGINGFLIPYATVGLLDTTLEKAWETRMKWEEIGAKAHEKALKLFDKNAGETLLNLISNRE
jgi:L-malate glycosyltransferase